KKFVDTACSKLNIDSDNVDDVFRDGRAVSGDRSRIVKVKFKNMRSHRTFLTGFLGIRSELPGGPLTYVRPDLTYLQRQQDRQLRIELKERREAGENVKISRGRIVPK
ncbi:MAG: hypothetical protein MJA29_11130, partial [Candidatus Omnitrophica bacterium]|nr:hypothetical protein [Candidatus Omnitrophota bacterium]